MSRNTHTVDYFDSLINNKKEKMLISYFCNFLFLSPVGVVVAVELGQRELLQFDLQLLVLPLQVHDHAVQEVDLMETIRTQVRTDLNMN